MRVTEWLTIPMLLATCTATLAAQATTYTDHLSVTATAESPRVFRIDVASCDPPPCSQRPGGVLVTESEHARVSLLPTPDFVDLHVSRRRGGEMEPYLTIEHRPLDEYGRASVPGLEIRWNAADGEAIYGLGERFNGLDQFGKPVEMWIKDSPGAGAAQCDSYFCTPVLFSSRGYALFATDNPDGAFDFNTAGDGHHRYRRAGQRLTYYVALGDGLTELLEQRAAIQGPFRGVPDWAWGPWISRNSYETQAEAEAALHGMLARGLPVAAIVQEAWKGRSTTGDFNNFAAERWPDLARYLELCATHDIRTILWQVPILHPSSPHYAPAADAGYFVKTPTGETSLRRQWLAGYANLDFTNPAALDAWFAQQRDEIERGIAGYKADDGEDIKPDDVFHDGRQGWQLHNDYSTLYNQALYELLDEHRPDGLLWCRSGSLGIERTPALWAGDQLATWEQLRGLIGAGLSAGLSGAPFWSHDIGGFAGTPTPELYIRWAQFGAFSPLMQYHGKTPREPWLFGPEAEAAYRQGANLRMMLRPTLIALGQQAVDSGLPIMRPMIMEFPDDDRFLREDSQYMLGPDLLVAPVLEPDVSGRVVKFPRGNWQHLSAPLVYAGPSEIDVPLDLQVVPVFVREGARLAVERDPNGGDWRPGLPVTTLAFDAHRPRLRNLSWPRMGNAITRRAVLHCESLGEGEIEVHVSDRRGTSRVIASATDPTVFELTPPDDTEMPISQQIEVRTPASDEPLFGGRLTWKLPVRCEARVLEQWVVEEGRRTVETTIENASTKALAFELSLTGDERAHIRDPELGVTVAADASASVRWPLQFSAGDSRASAELTVRLAYEGRVLLERPVFISPPWRWVTVGPLPPAYGTPYETVFAPRWHITPDIEFTRAGERWRWQPLHPDHVLANDGVDFGSLYGARRDVAGFALTKLRSDRQQPVEFRFGSDDTLTVWLNGHVIHDAEVYRAAQPDQDTAEAVLEVGVNTLLIKVAQSAYGWRLMARVTGPDGAALSGVTDGFDDWAQYGNPSMPRRRVPLWPTPIRWSVSDPIDITINDRIDWTRELAQQTDAAAWPPQAAGVSWPHSVEARGPIDFTRLIGDRTHASVYAAAILDADRLTAIEITARSDDGLRLWLNGELLCDADEWSGGAPDNHRIRATLAAGQNRLLAEIVQKTGDWRCLIDVWDSSSTPPRPFGAE